MNCAARPGNRSPGLPQAGRGAGQAARHRLLEGRQGPAIASTDYMKLFADQVRAWVPTDYHVLGTDGYGRSDTREKLRHFFEVNRYFVTVTALKALADRGEIDRKVVAEAIEKYGIDPTSPIRLRCESSTDPVAWRAVGPAPVKSLKERDLE